MSLGEKILKLRKMKGLSQEELGEKVEVTRQTISNWELGETTPNTEQLKLLSKTLNTSIDELLDNDINNVLVERVSNTEKLAGLVLRVLKWLGIIFVFFLVIDVVALIIFTTLRTNNNIIVSETQEVELTCSLNNNDYIINVGSDGYFNCPNCTEKIQKELKNNYIDFGDITKTAENIKLYFENNNGTCE